MYGMFVSFFFFRAKMASSQPVFDGDEGLMKAFSEVGKEQIELVNLEIEKELNAWETQTVKIAVIGQPGVGKSTWINKFRGLTQYENGETTLYRSKFCTWPFTTIKGCNMHKPSGAVLIETGRVQRVLSP